DEHRDAGGEPDDDAAERAGAGVHRPEPGPQADGHGQDVDREVVEQGADRADAGDAENDREGHRLAPVCQVRPLGPYPGIARAGRAHAALPSPIRSLPWSPISVARADSRRDTTVR